MLQYGVGKHYYDVGSDASFLVLLSLPYSPLDVYLVPWEDFCLTAVARAKAREGRTTISHYPAPCLSAIHTIRYETGQRLV